MAYADYTCPACQAPLWVDPDQTPKVACHQCGQHVSFYDPPASASAPDPLPAPTPTLPAPPPQPRPLPLPSSVAPTSQPEAKRPPAATPSSSRPTVSRSQSKRGQKNRAIQRSRAAQQKQLKRRKSLPPTQPYQEDSYYEDDQDTYFDDETNELALPQSPVRGLDGGSLLGNIIWIVFGGGFMAISYFLTGVLNMLTLIGIPAGLQCIKLGMYSLLPFGQHVESHRAGCISGFLNIIWFFTGGLVLALGHLLWALILLLPIVIYPFAVQHYRLAELALLPFGRDVVRD